MKKLVFLLIFTILTFSLQAKTFHAYMSYSVFNTPNGLPYIETYLNIQSSSLNFVKNEKGLFTGNVFVEILFRKVTDSTIVNFNKYVIHLPPKKDTNSFSFNLLDVQRYTLSEGNYYFELKISDKNSNRAPYVNYEKFNIAFPKNIASFSDIELLNSYIPSNDTSLLVKNGYKLIPYIFSYYPKQVKNLSFYTELYRPENTLKDGKYLIMSYIRPFEIDKKMDNYVSMQKVNPTKVKVLLTDFDISNLPSGNYLLVVEARNRENKIVTSKQVFFQRNNPATTYSIYQLLSSNVSNTFASKIINRDSLVEYIKYLYPISTEMDRDFAKLEIKNADITTLQKYFYGFWLQRNKQHPETAWLNYKQLVNQANHDFSTLALKGYQTDRGRVYLQYGPPNVMTKSYYEPAAYPYEIWHYYKLGDQRNKKFVFYSKDLATNDFQLIHSDAIGELSNYRWQTFIYMRTWSPNNNDMTTPPPAWGNDASMYYYHPR